RRRPRGGTGDRGRGRDSRGRGRTFCRALHPRSFPDALLDGPLLAERPAPEREGGTIVRPARSYLRRVMTARVLVTALKRAKVYVVRQGGSHLALVHQAGGRAGVPIHRAPLKPGPLRAILREAGMRPADLGLYL